MFLYVHRHCDVTDLYVSLRNTIIFQYQYTASIYKNVCPCQFFYQRLICKNVCPCQFFYQRLGQIFRHCFIFPVLRFTASLVTPLASSNLSYDLYLQHDLQHVCALWFKLYFRTYIFLFASTYLCVFIYFLFSDFVKKNKKKKNNNKQTSKNKKKPNPPSKTNSKINYPLFI